MSRSFCSFRKAARLGVIGVEVEEAVEKPAGFIDILRSLPGVIWIRFSCGEARAARFFLKALMDFGV